MNAKREGTPYWSCTGCGVWFQDPPPAKAYHGPEEPPITDADTAANRGLARWLFDNFLNGKPAKTLDIGCKQPVLARALADLGCDAHAMDAIAPLPTLGVQTIEADFERLTSMEWVIRVGRAFDLITMVHVFEHAYDPAAFLARVRPILKGAGGALFIRMPDHTVAGFERDLTPHHYAIHPFFHCLSSVAELCVRTGVFVISFASPLQPGQADLLLRLIDA